MSHPGNYGDRVTAARTEDVTNPDEWEVCRDSEDEDFAIEVAKVANEDGTYRTVWSFKGDGEKTGIAII